MKKKLLQYTAIFEKNEDGGYTIIVPALPASMVNFRFGNHLADDSEKNSVWAILGIIALLLLIF